MSAEHTITIGDLDKRIAWALEMATEVMGENLRQSALASALTERIEAGTTAHGLAEILEDRLSEVGQTSRLIECLENLQKEICHE